MTAAHSHRGDSLGSTRRQYRTFTAGFYEEGLGELGSPLIEERRQVVNTGRKIS